MPTISVIVPAYNSEIYIEEAIKSVQAQSGDLEIIVVDDGSSDNTLSIVKKMAGSDSRIKIISQRHSGKPSVARNRGIRHSSGEFLCFLDADDTILPGKLEKQLNLLRKYEEVGLIFHDVSEVSNGKPDEKSYLGKVDFINVARDYISPAGNGVFLCNTNYYNFMSAYFVSILVSAVMVRRSSLYSQSEWFPENVTIGEDIDLWYRLAQGNRFAYLNEILSIYRQHPASITQDVGRYLKGSIEIHKKNLNRGLGSFTASEKKKYEMKIRTLHWHYGYFLFRNYEMSSARREFAKALKLEFTAKVLLAILKTIIPASFVKFYRTRQRA